MTEATLITEGPRTGVRLQRRLADPPETVWEAITDPEQMRSWFPCHVALDGGAWVPGAAITFTFPSNIANMTIPGQVLEVDRPRRLAYTWGDETLRYELTADGGGTILVLIDELPPGIAARNAVGWETCLDRLEGRTGDRGEWQGRFEAYVAEFAPVLGEQEGRPAAYKGDS